jgi:short-subunit dehydrogenase
MKILKNKNCFLTGAASGIGRSFALALAEEGMNLFITDINIENLKKVKNEVEDMGSHVYEAKCDVSDINDWKNAAAEFYSKLGNLDLLINNAGIAIGGEILHISLGDWKKVLDVNLWGIIHSLEVFLPKLTEKRGGHIVNVASGAGILASAGPLPYVTSKFAVIGLSEALFGHLNSYDINVSVITPSYIKTNIYQKSKIKYPQKLLDDVEESKLREISASLLKEMGKHAISPSRAVKKYIEGIKNNQLYIYDSKAILRVLSLKGNNPQQYENFLKNTCKQEEEMIKKHFLKFGIDIEEYY